MAKSVEERLAEMGLLDRYKKIKSGEIEVDRSPTPSPTPSSTPSSTSSPTPASTPSPTSSLLPNYPSKWQQEAQRGLSVDWIKKNINPRTGISYAEERRRAQVQRRSQPTRPAFDFSSFFNELKNIRGKGLSSMEKTSIRRDIERDLGEAQKWRNEYIKAYKILPDIRKNYGDEWAVKVDEGKVSPDWVRKNVDPKANLSRTQKIWEKAAKELEDDGRPEVARKIRERHNIPTSTDTTPSPGGTARATGTAGATPPQFSPAGGIGTTHRDDSGAIWRYTQNGWRQESTGAGGIAGAGGATGGQSYTVQEGDTLSSIAARYGVSVRDITGYRSGDPDLIYPGETLNIGGGTSRDADEGTGGDAEPRAGDDTATTNGEAENWYTGWDPKTGRGYKFQGTSSEYQDWLARQGYQRNMPESQFSDKGVEREGDEVVSTSDEVTNEEKRQEKLKQEADKFLGEYLDRYTQDQELEIEDLTREQQLRNAREELGLDPETGEPLDQPALPSYETTYEALKAEEGIPALESRINDIDEEMRDMDASLRQGLYDEEGRLAPMEIIGTRQQKLQRQAQEQMDTLTRERQTLVDELKTKNNMISTTMNLKQMDYSAASDQYNKSFNRKVQINSMVNKREQAEEDAIQQVKENAEANLAVVTELASERGISWADLDETMKTQITQLERKADLPVGITRSFMSEMPGSEILAQVKGTDANGNDIVSFVYADENGMPGVVRTVKTGGVSTPGGSNVVSPGGGGLTVVDESGNEYDLLTDQGLRDAAEAGMRYEDAFQRLDNVEGISHTVIRDRLERAGFVQVGEGEQPVTDEQLPIIANALLGELDKLDGQFKDVPAILQYLNRGGGKIKASGGDVYSLTDEQLEKVKELVYNEVKDIPQ